MKEMVEHRNRHRKHDGVTDRLPATISVIGGWYAVFGDTRVQAFRICGSSTSATVWNCPSETPVGPK
jgi:hypothetical protein